MWASPKLRTPGVSITHPPTGSSRAIADDEVCRPRPVTALTMPTSRFAAGTRAFTSVDLPTPLDPISTQKVEELLYELPDRGREPVVVDAAMVRERLKVISEDEDLRKYIL